LGPFPLQSPFSPARRLARPSAHAGFKRVLSITCWRAVNKRAFQAQRIKNWTTKTAQVVKRLQSRYAFVLTGAPIENRIDELHSLMGFLDPSVLGPSSPCLENFCVRRRRPLATGGPGARRADSRIGSLATANWSCSHSRRRKARPISRGGGSGGRRAGSGCFHKLRMSEAISPPPNLPGGALAPPTDPARLGDHDYRQHA
jgi:hypothetical protein